MTLFFIGIISGWALASLFRSLVGPDFGRASMVYPQSRERGLSEKEARHMGQVYQAWRGINDQGMTLAEFRLSAMRLHIVEDGEEMK